METQQERQSALLCTQGERYVATYRSLQDCHATPMRIGSSRIIDR